MMHLIQLARKRLLQVPNRIPGWSATIAMRCPRRNRAPRWLLLAVIGIIVWGPMNAFGKFFDRSIGMNDGVSSSIEVDDAPAHGDVLVAGFGFQTSISSVITIRTYQARTGVVLSEDSYDLNVQEEAASGETKRDRIFAGGIGVDVDGQPRFLLRVYDALTGQFLWQGQLNLTSQKEDHRVRPIATIIPLRSIAWKAAKERHSLVQLNLSLRAVDPLTGRVVWEDRFIPGVSTSGRTERTDFRPVDRFASPETIGHIFNLVVRTVDRASGRFLWQDSFEDTDFIERAEKESGRRREPQTAPPGNDQDVAMPASHRPAGAAYDWVCCCLEWNA